MSPGTTANSQSRVAILLDEVAALAAEDRDAFLLEHCPDNPDLRQEVQRLAAALDQAGSFLQTPATLTSSGPLFTSGCVLAGKFLVESILGQGGMGQVYKAEDLVSGRHVALKTIRSDFAAQEPIRKRFISELLTAQEISHRNVCRVNDIWVHEDRQFGPVLFFSMELLPGETLAERIASRRKMPWRKVLAVAGQLAEGLDEVHRKGIVHRDLKPANVFVVPELDGAERVVVADFGLARSVSGSGSVDTQLTRFAGTPAYMAPEHRSSGEVTPASDLYAFGLILYEMLTGRTHPLEPLRQVPRGWNAAIFRCLDNSPARRPRSACEVADQLRHASQVYRRWFSGPRLAAATLAVSGLVATQLPLTRMGSTSFNRVTFDPGLSWEASLSRDGKQMVYASDREGVGVFRIWRQELPDGAPVRLTDSGFHDTSPVLSPDGTLLAYRSEQDGGGIYLKKLPNGVPRLFAVNGRQPRFSPDGGKLLYWTGVEGDHSLPTGRIWLGVVETGQTKMLAPHFVDAKFPAWSEDGRFILFRGSQGGNKSLDDSSDWWVTPADLDDPRPTGAFQAFRDARISLHDCGVVWKDNQVYFAARAGHGTNLWRIPIPLWLRKIRGAPERLTTGTDAEADPWPTPEGAVVYTNWRVEGHVWRVWLKGPRRGQAEQLTTEDSLDTRASVSADGRRIAYTNRLGEVRNLWVRDLASGQSRAVVKNQAVVPYISPDGQQVSYGTAGSNPGAISVLTIANEKVSTICDACGELQGWASDGSGLLYIAGTAGERRSVWLLNMAGERRQLLADAEFSDADLSPDGKFVAFSIRTGGMESTMYIASVSGSGPAPRSEWREVSDPKVWSDKPRWSVDGRTLYYYSQKDGFGCLWQRAFTPKQPELVGAPAPVWHLHEGRRSTISLSRPGFSVGVAREFLVFNALDLRGNLWVTSRSPAKYPTDFWKTLLPNSK